MPRTLDPALAPDLPSLNVAHELYAGLTRFSGSGVVPDLAASWDVDQRGLVWTFHLRKGIHWSDGRSITAADFRRAWFRALDPATNAPFAGPELGIVHGARRFHATGQGAIGAAALDSRTLRVTLQHPVPWFDQLVAFPVSFPWRRGAFSGPFGLRSKGKRLVLVRNDAYWNARAVKPRRLVLSTHTSGVDAVLPRGLAAPGLPWVETAEPPAAGRWNALPTLSVNLLWFVSRRLREAGVRQALAAPIPAALHARPIPSLIPPAMPASSGVLAPYPVPPPPRLVNLSLALAYTSEEPEAEGVAETVKRELASEGVTVRLVPFPSLEELVRAAGPPARPDLDLVLLGWSSKLFDPYNILDLFTCTSAFNIAQWCDRRYDALMRRAVRTLDDQARWRIERRLVRELAQQLPAAPLYVQDEFVRIKPGVHGFRWSPIGFYELAGLTRS